jgi:hypothetical protein
MRCLLLAVVYVVLCSSLVSAAPTVFLKDGTKQVGNSVWTENSKVYLSISKEVYEYGPDEVKLEETLKYNKLGRYQVVVPDEPVSVPGTTKSKRHRTSKGAVTQAAPRTGNRPAKTVAAAAPVAVPSSAAPVSAVVSPAPKTAAPPTPAPTQLAQEPVTPAAAPSVPAAVKISSGFPVVVLLISLAVTLLILAAYWVLYERAGQAGWKSLIPFYNMYILMEISGKPGWWLFLLFIPLVGVVIYLLAMLSLAKKFGRSELFGVGIFLLPMIFLPLLAFGDSKYER